MQMTLESHVGYATDEVRFPADLSFTRANMQEALLPILPGIVLEDSFFKQAANYEINYPGYPGVFADFVALKLTSGQFAMYTTPGGQPLYPTVIGFNASSCANGYSTCYTHSFKPKAADGSVWTSPQVVIRIGQDWQQSIQAFRQDDGLADAPSIQTKLGDLYEPVIQSPMYKADNSQLNLKFKDYPAYLASVPTPGILHLVAFQPRGFDRNYPDFIPPNPDYGTTADLSAMFKQVKEMGFVVMPYTNPTWWDEKAPTLMKLPAGTSLSDVATLNEMGMQIEECYGCPGSPKYGYVVSPYSKVVTDRLDLLMKQITQDVPSDMVFEDQIGARAAVFDYGKTPPSADMYLQGWLDHTAKYSANHLMTELGFDRLVMTEVGLDGSVLLPERTNLTMNWWWNGTWHYYPFVGMAARDKVLFYQHDLAPETFTQQKSTLTWNAAMGYMTGYDPFKAAFGGGKGDPFIQVAAAFQRDVFATYAAERVTDYVNVQPDVTRTTFETVAVTANWSTQESYTQDGFELAPQGLLVQAQDGSLTAGIFLAYNGVPLSTGDHYLIEQRAKDAITLHQPVGAEGDITLELLKGWKDGMNLSATAYDAQGKVLGTSPAAAADGKLTFTYQTLFDMSKTAYYVIAPGR